MALQSFKHISKPHGLARLSNGGSTETQRLFRVESTSICVCGSVTAEHGLASSSEICLPFLIASLFISIPSQFLSLQLKSYSSSPPTTAYSPSFSFYLFCSCRFPLFPSPPISSNWLALFPPPLTVSMLYSEAGKAFLENTMPVVGLMVKMPSSSSSMV